MPTLAAQVYEDVTTKYSETLEIMADLLKATVDGLLHLGLDPAFTPNDSEPLLFLTAAQNPLEVASCYPTARDLFPVIAGTASGPHGSAPNVRFTEAGQVRAAVNALCQAVQNSQDTVFRVELAGHGFTLVTRKTDAGGPVMVELIETIANHALITPSLSAAPKSPDVVANALLGAVDDSIDIRRASMAAMGWDADDFWLGDKTGSDPVFPNIEFRWWSGALRPEAAALWFAQFTQRLKLFGALAQRDAWGDEVERHS